MPAGGGDFCFEAAQFQNGATKIQRLLWGCTREGFGDECGQSADHGGLGIHLEDTAAVDEAGVEPDFGEAAFDAVVFGAKCLWKRRFAADAVLDVGEAFERVFEAEQFLGKSGLAIGRGHGEENATICSEGKSVASGAGLPTIGAHEVPPLWKN